jgi:hypothetical protein
MVLHLFPNNHNSESNICKVDGKNVAFSSTYITSAITKAAASKATTDLLKELPQCDLSSTHARDLAFCQPKVFNNHPVVGKGTLNFPNVSLFKK